MRSPTRTTAAILAGAVAVSAAAYGIGTQVGGGAGPSLRGWQHGPGGGLEQFARELGVEPSELREFRERKGSGAWAE